MMGIVEHKSSLTLCIHPNPRLCRRGGQAGLQGVGPVGRRQGQCFAAVSFNQHHLRMSLYSLRCADVMEMTSSASLEIPYSLTILSALHFIMLKDCDILTILIVYM